MRYEGTIYRPPGEWRSYLLQVTVGCSNNQCTFCGMYKGKKFHIRPLADIFEDIDMARAYYAKLGRPVKRVFLCDGDAVVMPTGQLLAILKKLYDTFPELERVTSYAGPRSTLAKTPEELRQLREAGLYRVYLGVETGDDALLRAIRKGVGAAEMLEAGVRLREAGLDLWVMVLLGLAGPGEPSRRHIQATAEMMNAMKPRHLSALTLMAEPGTELGGLLPQVQEETGKTDARVLTVASHDTASAVLAVPVQEKDFIYISSGTWSLMGTELASPLINEESRMLNFTNEGGVCGTVRFLKNIMGLWIIQESRRQWKREGQDYSFAQLEAWARESEPFRSLIDVDDPAFSTPGNMPERIREFCRRTGQPVPGTVGEVVRCIYESLALKYRMTADHIQALMGRQATVIHVVGGGTKDRFLCQMTADACGIPVSAGPEEATAIGNLMMQAIAAGEVADLRQARQVVSASFECRRYEPAAGRDAWETAYGRLCAMQAGSRN